MLEVQKYLQDHTIEQLQDEFSIKTTHHEDGRVILNYQMIESYKDRYHPIVGDCRGLTLDSNNDYALVARSFRRFFNLGEHIESQKKFCWEGSGATDKEDGSLLIIYYWNNEWQISTRGSFGEGMVNNGVMTWHELAEIALPDRWRINFFKHYTYVCELCSLHNKIVREYKKPKIYLLTTFHGEIEHSPTATNNIGNHANLEMPDFYKFRDAYDAVAHISRMVESDITYEGVVIRDKNNRRLKAKSPIYVRLHRAINNHSISAENIIDIILKNEQDELILYFPEIKPKIDKYQQIINQYQDEILELWEKYKYEKSQKKFANSIKKHPFSWVLFQARKTKNDPLTIFFSNHKIVCSSLKKIGV